AQVMLLQPRQGRTLRNRLSDHRRWPTHATQLGNVGASTNTAFDITFGVELIESAGHGIARDAQPVRQLAAGRQARAAWQTAIENALTQCLIELARQPLLRVEIDTRQIDRERWSGRRGHQIGSVEVTESGSYNRPIVS